MKTSEWALHAEKGKGIVVPVYSHTTLIVSLPSKGVLLTSPVMVSVASPTLSKAIPSCLSNLMHACIF